MDEKIFTDMNGGKGYVAAKIFVNASGTEKIIVSHLKPGASIGLHSHATSSNINFVVSGEGKAICNGSEEILSPGVCHYCPQGSEHTIINTGSKDLVLYTVVQERN